MDDGNNDIPSEDTVRELLAVQKQEQTIRFSEIQAQEAHLNNHKEVALASLKFEKEDRADGRRTHKTESTKAKVFVGFLVCVFAFIICFLVVNGEADLVQILLIEVSKVLLGAFGGFGFALYYFQKSRKDET